MGQEHMYVTALLGEAQVHGIYDEETHSLDIAENEYARYSSKKLFRYNDLKSACNDPGVDALFICTPNYTHLDVLKVAMESKKPIFLEKPMAATIEDASEIVRLVDGYPSFIQIGLQYRYKAQYVEAIHEALERKTIGDLKTISISEHRPPFLDKVKNNTDFYFVNSYVFLPEEKKFIIANTKYDVEFCSIIAKKNIFGVQFHPEKSSFQGKKILDNFLKINA